MQETILTKTKVELMGKKYTLKGNINPDYLHKVVRYVDQKIKELKDISPKADASKLSLLVALNLADELFQAKEEYQHLHSLQKSPDIVQNRLEEMLSILEEGIIGEYLPNKKIKDEP